MSVWRSYRFALVPPIGFQNSSRRAFYDVVMQGCLERAEELMERTILIDCVYIEKSPFHPPEVTQADLIREQLLNVDGLMISVDDTSSGEDMTEVIDLAQSPNYNVPVVTLEQDNNNESSRVLFIGSNEFLMGIAIGHLIQSFLPEGGTYAMIADNTSARTLNRSAGVLDVFANDEVAYWTEVERMNHTVEDPMFVLQEMERILNTSTSTTTDLMLCLFESPLQEWITYRNLYQQYAPTTKFIFAVDTGLAHHDDLIRRELVDGLISQMPYQMGSKGLETLFSIRHQSAPLPTEQTHYTSFMRYARLPNESLMPDDPHIRKVEYTYTLYIFFLVLVVIPTLCIYRKIRKN